MESAFGVEGRCFGRRNAGWPPGAVLPTVDMAGELPRGPAFFVDIGRRDQLFQQPDLVIGIQNREVGLQPHQFGMAAQYLGRQRVERAHPGHPLRRIAQ